MGSEIRVINNDLGEEIIFRVSSYILVFPLSAYITYCETKAVFLPQSIFKVTP